MASILERKIERYQAQKAKSRRKSNPSKAVTETSEFPVKIFTVQQAADFLHISDETVYKLIRSHALGHIQISNKRYVIREDDLMAYLNSNHRPAISA